MPEANKVHTYKRLQQKGRHAAQREKRIDQLQKEFQKLLMLTAQETVDGQDLPEIVESIDQPLPVPVPATGGKPWPAGRERGWVAAAVVIVAGLLLLRVPLSVGGVGKIMPEHRVAINAPESAQVLRVNCRYGQTVQAGETLFEMDVRKQMIEREHKIQRRLFALSELRQLRIQENELQAAYQRKQALADSKLLSATDAEQSLGALEGNRLRQIEIQQSVAALEETIALLEETIRSARLLAPLSGIVMTPRVLDLQGQFVQAGDPMCELSDPRGFLVQLAVNENLVPRLKPGMPAMVRFDAFPGRVFPGRIETVGTFSIDGYQAGSRVFKPQAGYLLLPTFKFVKTVGVGIALDHWPSQAVYGMDARVELHYGRFQVGEWLLQQMGIR